MAKKEDISGPDHVALSHALTMICGEAVAKKALPSARKAFAMVEDAAKKDMGKGTQVISTRISVRSITATRPPSGRP